MILNNVLHVLEEGRSPILLTERREHLELLAEELRPFVKNIIVLKAQRLSGFRIRNE